MMTKRIAGNQDEGRSYGAECRTAGSAETADLILSTDRGHRIATPTAEIRVTSPWGCGRLVYATDDGFCGIQLDGETRVDEYPARYVRRAK